MVKNLWRRISIPVVHQKTAIFSMMNNLTQQQSQLQLMESWLRQLADEALCDHTMSNLWNQWQDGSVLISQSEKYGHVWKCYLQLHSDVNPATANHLPLKKLHHCVCLQQPWEWSASREDKMLPFYSDVFNVLEWCVRLNAMFRTHLYLWHCLSQDLIFLTGLYADYVLIYQKWSVLQHTSSIHQHKLCELMSQSASDSYLQYILM